MFGFSCTGILPKNSKWSKAFSLALEDSAQYAVLLLAPAEGFVKKESLIIMSWPIFCNFWCPVVALVTFSSNLINFEKNPNKRDKKNPKKRGYYYPLSAAGEG